MNKNVLKKLSKIESKVELAEVRVELGYLQDVLKDADDQLKKYSDIPELMKFHNDAQQWIFKNKKPIEDFNTTRNIYLDKMSYEIERLKGELKDIDSKFKSIGINSMESPEYKSTLISTRQLEQLKDNLQNKTTDIKVTFK